MLKDRIRIGKPSCFRTEYLAVNLGRLIDDVKERHDENDPPQTVPLGMIQREREHGQRFSAAGGSSQRKSAGRIRRGCDSRRIELLPQRRYRVAGMLASDSRDESIQRGNGLIHIERGAIDARDERRSSVAIEVSLRREEVGIHQGGKQHSRIKHVAGRKLAATGGSPVAIKEFGLVKSSSTESLYEQLARSISEVNSFACASSAERRQVGLPVVLCPDQAGASSIRDGALGRGWAGSNPVFLRIPLSTAAPMVQ